MSNNKNLHNAKEQKNDEFYTELSEIEKELQHYKKYFKDKIVFCNCDDPYESKFVQFFLMNFNNYGLKALYTTGYKISYIVGEEVEVKEDEKPYSLKINSTKEYLRGDQIDLDIIGMKEFMNKEANKIRTKLNGNNEYLAGDFRSNEAVGLLKESDIIVTNPPFSLFREYVDQLLKYQKQFLIIGNKLAITYKEIYPLFKEQKIWLGITQPNIFTDKTKEIVKNIKGQPRWFTNLDHEKRHTVQPLKIGCTYKNHESQYPSYDNCDAIDVKYVNKIPTDYNGVMGVPPTFMDKYCPEQFEIISFRKGSDGKDLKINNKSTYFRILIKKINNKE